MGELFKKRNPSSRFKSASAGSGFSLVSINNRQVGGLLTKLGKKKANSRTNSLNLNLLREEGNARIGGRLGKMFARKSSNKTRGRGRPNDFSLANRGNYDPEARLGGFLGNALKSGRLGAERRLKRPLVYIKPKKSRKKNREEANEEE